MDDDRVPGGPLFGGKDAGDGLGREGVGAEAVDGFSGQGDQAAGAQDGRGLRQRGAGFGRVEVVRIDL